jgi:hypothetical protein
MFAQSKVDMCLPGVFVCLSAELGKTAADNLIKQTPLNRFYNNAFATHNTQAGSNTTRVVRICWIC